MMGVSIGFGICGFSILWLAAGSVKAWATAEHDDGDRPGFLMVAVVCAVVGLAAVGASVWAAAKAQGVL